MSNEIDYLLDASSIIVHISLDIPEIAQNPRKLLCGPLRITPKKLQSILHKLNQLDLIELSDTGAIQKVNQGHTHYSKDHPLMRSHIRSMLKTLSASRLIELRRISKGEFHGDPFPPTVGRWSRSAPLSKRSLKQVEKIAISSKKESTYQLTFDLFPWL